MSYPNYNFTLVWDRLSEWSQSTFGSDLERGPIGPLKHLIKEANEALSSPNDIKEYADCLLLVLDAARRAGFLREQLIMATLDKLSENANRTYPKPTTDEPSEHIR